MPKIIAPTFQFIGNHAALDFVNTKIAFQGSPLDLLVRFADLLDWLTRAGFIAAEEAAQYEAEWDGSPAAAEALATAVALRGHLREAIRSAAAGSLAPAAAIDAMNRAVNKRPPVTELAQREGGFVRRKRYTYLEPSDLLTPVAEAAVEFLTEQDPALVRSCENPACVLMFHDTSKNGGRRWCSPKTCGNRMKVAAYLERQRSK